MGLVGFLDFVFKFVQLLAWPSFALGYPLCASIKAIETNSNNQMRKLVTYWILFSLVSLFEHTFSKLLEWVPLWFYIKIVAICWLIIPRFNGASIVYMHLVRPCLSMQLLQFVLDHLNKKPDLSQKGESFLAVAERYVNENGTEALEKLIARKPKVKEPTVIIKDIKEPMIAQKDIKAVEILDKVASAAEKKTTTNATAVIEIKNMTPASLPENVLPLPPYMNVQKEWTCAVCQVTTQSEAILNSHLQGRKHRARCEELKGGKPAVTKKGLSNARPNIKRTCTICQVTTDGEVTWISHLQGVKHKSKVEELEAERMSRKDNSSCTTINSDQDSQDQKQAPTANGPDNFRCDICQVTLSEVPWIFHLQGAKHKAKAAELEAREQQAKKIRCTTKLDEANKDPKKTLTGKGPNNKFGCDLCQVTLQSEATMKSHIQGEKHKSKAAAMKSHIQGEKHKSKAAELEAREQQAKKIRSTTKLDEANKDSKKTLTGKGPNNKSGCDLCQVTLQSEATMKSHIQGEKHKSKCEQLKAKERTEKDKTYLSAKNPEQANQSSIGSDPSGGLNQKKAALVMIKVQANVNNGYHSCSMCSVTCTSESDMASHLRGNRHLSQIEDSVQSSSVHYWCNICDVTCKSNIDMSSHLYGTKHASQLDSA